MYDGGRGNGVPESRVVASWRVGLLGPALLVAQGLHACTCFHSALLLLDVAGKLKLRGNGIPTSLALNMVQA